MKSFNKVELKSGDKVLTYDSGYAGFLRAIVLRFTPKQVWIIEKSKDFTSLDDEEYVERNKVLRYPKDLVHDNLE